MQSCFSLYIESIQTQMKQVVKYPAEVRNFLIITWTDHSLELIKRHLWSQTLTTSQSKHKGISQISQDFIIQPSHYCLVHTNPTTYQKYIFNICFALESSIGFLASSSIQQCLLYDAALLVINIHTPISKVKNTLFHLQRQGISSALFFDQIIPDMEEQLDHLKLLDKQLKEINLQLNTVQEIFNASPFKLIQGNIILGNIQQDKALNHESFTRIYKEKMAQQANNKQKLKSMELLSQIIKSLAEKGSEQTNGQKRQPKKKSSVRQAIIGLAIRVFPSSLNAQINRVNQIFPYLPQSLEKIDGQSKMIAYCGAIYLRRAEKPWILVRLLAGTLKIGDQVWLYPKGLAKTKITINKVIYMTPQKLEEADFVHAGQTVFIQTKKEASYFGSYILSEELRQMNIFTNNKKQVKGGYCIQISPKQAVNLPYFVGASRKVAMIEPSIAIETNETGAFNIRGTLEDAKKALSVLHTICPHQIKEKSYVSLREVPTAPTPKGEVLMTKSANRHNRVYATATPLDPQMVNLLEKEPLFCVEKRYENQVLIDKQYRLLRQKSEEWKWQVPRKEDIWCFGPENESTNLLTTDPEFNWNNYYDRKERISSAFTASAKYGPLAEEPIRGLHMTVVNFQGMVDSIHCGAGQMFPATRRLLYALMLRCRPTIYEPYRSFSVLLPEQEAYQVQEMMIREGIEMTDRWTNRVLNQNLSQVSYYTYS